MQGAQYIPNPSRSSTAVPGVSDYRDENIYSALVLAHGGATQRKMFTVPSGQTIPTIAGASIAPTQAHHLTYSEVTTNLSKAGEFGSSIGDTAIKRIGLQLEQAPIGPTGTISAWGATALELHDVMSKVFFQFFVAGKKQLQGPVWAFPSAGGSTGALSTTANAAMNSIVVNGFGQARGLQYPIGVSRSDTVEGVVGVAGGSSLVFSVTSGVGQSSLLWCMLGAIVAGDAR